MTITHSTISGNVIVQAFGGGIYNTGTLTVTHSTISGNNAYDGSGIFSPSGTATLRNTILANPGSNCETYSLGGTFIDGGYNLDSGTTCGFTAANNSLSNADPKLGPLQNNGGPTATHALLPGSAAIDAGTCTDHNGARITSDQRGYLRPKSGCDIGAYEYGASPPPDETAPTITLTTPADGAVYLLGQVVLASYSCQDEADGSGLASCSGTVANGAAITTASVGAKSFTVTASDNAGNPATLTHDYSVIYNFSGFFAPVDNLPTLNVAKAGSAIPVKFSLGGNQGLSIFASGSPSAPAVPCNAGDPTDALTEVVNAGSSSLSYDAATQQYTYVWKTDKAWANSCRTLTMTLVDGTTTTASFKFTK